MRKKAKIKHAYSAIVPVDVTQNFTWLSRVNINDKEITKRVFGELVGVLVYWKNLQ
jgi:hypothetical protein